jgi:hypothetical protein
MSKVGSEMQDTTLVTVDSRGMSENSKVEVVSVKVEVK